jgi:hypothetical protein
MAFHARLKEATNQSDWALPIQFIDRATGDLIDLSSDTFQLALVPTSPPGSTYPVLTGSTVTGELTVTGLGILYVYFPAARMSSLVPGTYKVGLTISNGVQTAQVLVGHLPVRDGIVMPPQGVLSS